jgi:Na+-translocating ferredoxin:NAD+ oxidoreductase RNF subunit RnfB
MITTILIPTLLIGTLGFLFGLALAYASKVFYVEIDPKIEQIANILPGANCGACGYPGCNGYADSIVKEGVEFMLCAPIGSTGFKKIGDILGKTAIEKEKHIAIIKCNSGGYSNTTYKYQYNGVRACRAVTLLANGPNACNCGCVFQNDCLESCMFNAMYIDDKGMRVIDQNRCTGCSACVQVCPRNIIKLAPISKKVHIMCSSTFKGVYKNKNCGNKTPCIACGICEKKCPFNAITIENDLAIIDYTLCISCGLCQFHCPTNAILDFKKRGKAVIDEDLCIGCTICAKKCVVKCISGELKHPHKINENECIGCEVCVDKCPRKAIKLIFYEIDSI